MEAAVVYWCSRKPILIMTCTIYITLPFLNSHLYLCFSFAGCLATVGALSFGLVSFKRGNMAMSQTMMRLRVVAQGGTVIALIAGMAMASNKNR